MRALWEGASSAAAGRFSLQAVVYASLALCAVAAAMSVWILVFRAWAGVMLAYGRRRRAVYEPGVEKVLLDEPLEAVVEAFRPRRVGDRAIVLETMLDSMDHLAGAPFETMRRAAERLGLVDDCLRGLRSRGADRRGRAMEALGIMRERRAIVVLLDVLETETLDLKLTALRALARIGDPAVLPYLTRAARTMPPAMMTRLASLALEFGPPGRKALAALVTERPGSFPPRVLRAVLEQAALE